MVEHSDEEGAERVGKAVGGGAPGLRRAEEALRMAAKGGPEPGAGGFRRGRFRGGKLRGDMHLVYMMVNRFGMRTIDFEINS